MPLRLKQILTDNFTNQTDEIRNIPHSCCNNSIEVFNFDSIKDQFCDLLGFNERTRSCDCLYINSSGTKMIFIEMKDFEDSLIHNRGRYSKFSEYLKAFKRKINDFQLDDKIIDSYALVLSIAGYYNVDRTFYSSILNINNKIIKYFILVNINHSDYITISLSTLDSIASRHEYRFISGNTAIITENEFCSYLGTI